MTKAVILAAGRGSRMGILTEEIPKCLNKVGGQTLLDWQLYSLSKAGISDIGIVMGYKQEQLKEYGNYNFFNNNWAKTNMVYTLLCADSWLMTNEIIVSYSDIFYSPDTVSNLLKSKSDIAISYDKNWYTLWQKRFSNPLNDAETLKLKHGYVSEIGKRIKIINNVEGQYMGLIKITPHGYSLIKSYLKTLTEKELASIDMTSMLSKLIQEDVPVAAVVSNDEWGEVDSENDLNIYNKMYLENKLTWMRNIEND